MSGLALRIRIALGTAAIVAVPHPAHATNGLNLLGFGSESSLMAGADTAVARDAASLNTNPAGLAQLRGKALDVYGGSAYALDVGHADGYGNDVGVSNKLVHVAGFGYAFPVSGTDVTLGAGAFVQGGAGAVFKNLRTPFGTRDELSSQFGAFKPVMGAAWRVDPQLMLGVAFSAFIGMARQKIFPNTSVLDPVSPAHTFFGSTLRNAYGVAPGLKLGFLYRLSPAWTLGGAYTSKARLPLKHGDLSVNMSAAGLGEVSYRDVRLDGLAFPHQVAAGLAWRPSEKWLWALKVEWLNWANALKTSTLTASSPSNSAAPPQLSSTQTLGWRDQLVVALGLATRLDDRHTARAGLNYGRNPIPRERSNPLMNAVGEKHITFGLSRRLDQQYEIHGGIEYQAGKRVRYFNPELPFGPDVEVRNRHMALHAMLSRRW